MDIFISKLKLSNINTHPVLNYLICMCRPTMALYITHAFECNNAFCCYEIHISSDFGARKFSGPPWKFLNTPLPCIYLVYTSQAKIISKMVKYKPTTVTIDIKSANKIG